jgi:hypothetical protein
LGATDEEIAEAFDVSGATIKNWKSDYPEFLASITQGKVEADARVAESTFKLATDDVWIEEEKLTKTETWKQGFAIEGSRSKVKREVITETLGLFHI